MVEIIFTLDYEIYGNGGGSLKELVYEPAQKLTAVFKKWNARFVAFIEVAELEIIETSGTDKAIDLVKNQVRDFQRDGYELGLHLHPQWYNGQFRDGKWALDYGEYNLGALPRERIVQIIDRSIAYLRKLSGADDFTPFSFRAGNWLFQPPRTLASVLAERGIKVDSSVFKGGLQHQHKLDYRRALKNGYFWMFSENVNVPNPNGLLIELPIYTRMQPIWKMVTSKRIGLQQKATTKIRGGKRRPFRLADYVRFMYPIKLDYCRMSIRELVRIIDIEMHKDQQNPNSYRPIIAIGHTKDLIDINTVDTLLSVLEKRQIKISGFHDVYVNCKC